MGQPTLINQNHINGPQSQISECNPSVGSNETQQLLSWSDKAGALVPIFQDYFILGDDRWQNISTFHVVVIGDSIAWGAGLEREEKYYYNVAKWLQKKLKRPVEVTVLAHTGATLVGPNLTQNTLQDFINPDLSSRDPTLLEQANKISNPEDVDLILLSGGINDIDVNTILNPLTDPDQLRSLCKGIEEPLQNVLVKLLSKCTNSKIIVTSYYPIVSNATTESAFNVFVDELQNLDPNSIEGKGLNLIKNLFGAKRTISMMSNNSNLFDNQSRLSISTAIEQANRYSVSHFKEKRIFFAPVNFPSNRSYGTNESWLWVLTDPRTNNGKPINDHKYIYRVSLCEKTLCNWNDKINAIGHPNAEGANEYNRTVINILSFYYFCLISLQDRTK